MSSLYTYACMTTVRNINRASVHKLKSGSPCFTSQTTYMRRLYMLFILIHLMHGLMHLIIFTVLRIFNWSDFVGGLKTFTYYAKLACDGNLKLHVTKCIVIRFGWVSANNNKERFTQLRALAAAAAAFEVNGGVLR